MTRLLRLLGAGVVLALAFTGSGALATATETCNGPIGGSHGSVIVTGTCAVVSPLTIDGNLTLANGSVFAGFGPAVHITGDVLVGRGAQFALGYNRPEGVLGPDTVDGNVVAYQPLSLYIGNSTVHGSLVSIGGGTTARFYNFPIKDNRIDGNVTIAGWTGGWWGLVANSIGGNVLLFGNRSLVVPAHEDQCPGTFPAGCEAAAGVDEDASEVQSRIIPGVRNNPQHISGNLICFANSPAVHFNPADGGARNVVDGAKLGECAGV
jgi:hypothetical protein